jgi:hypothetical protein
MNELKNREIKKNAEIQYLRTKLEKMRKNEKKLRNPSNKLINDI